MLRKPSRMLTAIWGITVAILVCWTFFSNCVYAQLPSNEETTLAEAAILRKIEPEILKQSVSAPEASQRFLVYMEEQPELPETSALADMSRLTRRQAVVETLRNTARSAQQDILQFLAGGLVAGQVESVHPYWIFNGLAVTASSELVLQIAQRKDVQSVRPDRIRYLSDVVGTEKNRSDTVTQINADAVEWNIQKIRADQVWNALNIDGSGAVVANMDTGVDWRHPALFDNYRGNMGKGFYDHWRNWFCATDEGYVEPTDVYGHGTHTMGTMVGRKAGHAAIGVAPGAKWIAVKIFSDDGIAYDSWIHSGFEWILDPGDTGNPALIPDVVNNSWGSSLGFDETFRPDVRAWRAAGIVPIFSAGNDGPSSETVGSPGSFPESITAGATNDSDYVVYFSSRGPSIWGLKPDVSAPGMGVVSSVPGGLYAAYAGTSMAAPHVAGLSALILQVNPFISVEQLETILTSTAVRRSSPIPNNEYGWGRIDAYQAVATAGKPGHLQGMVRRSSDHQPVSGAEILAQAFLPSEGFAQTISDGSGQFAVSLAPWTYDVTANAFGYYPANVSSMKIVTGTTLSHDFSLLPLPMGRLEGQVIALESGSPLSATLIISGTPVSVAASPSTGHYSVELPAGVYSIQAQSWGHQVGWSHEVAIEVGQTTNRDFTLSQIPTILLVDSGAWYMGSQAIYFQQALDDLHYLYDKRTIYQIYGPERSVPTADELARYDIVIWSCPQDSPGYADAWGALVNYLWQGGNLFLTGQDIGYWDNPDGPFVSPEYGQYLKAQFVQDDSGSTSLLGLGGGLLQGLNLSLSGGDGANNQNSPDEIAPLNDVNTERLATYENDGLGAQAVSNCSPYRLIYFSFGFEGINQRETRREVMKRVIDAFTSSPEPVANRLTPASQSGIQAAGQNITYTLQVHNLNPNGLQDAYHLSLEGHTWPGAISANIVTVAPCDLTTVTVTVTVPSDTTWNVTDMLTVSAQSTLSPTVKSTAIISTSSPAPILLVDDDRWYDMESFYQTALEQNALSYNYWKVGWKPGEWIDSPPPATLRMYPMIVWFTGYDWFSPLTENEEQNLADALDNGSNLFLSSQDYLYVRDITPFGQNYLGIDSYSEEMTTTQVVGVRDNSISQLLPSYSLAYPYPNRSDEVTPIQTMDIAFKGDQYQSVALSHSAPSFRTSFFAFPFEAIDSQDGRRQVMRQTCGWLSWLGGSTFAANDNLATSGATVTYTLNLRNDGWQPVHATASNLLPPLLTFEPGSLTPPEASYDVGTNQITWSKNLAVGEQAQMTYRATITNPLPSTPITNIVQVGYDEHHIEFDIGHILDVNAPDLSGSSLSVDKSIVEPGGTLTYTISLRNDGVLPATSVALTDPIPIYTSYVTGSLAHEGGGTANDANGIITWTGSLGLGERVTLTYRVEVMPDLYSVTIRNFAYLRDEYAPMRRLEAKSIISPDIIWLPTIYKR